MIREIKFRGKGKYSGIWVFGDYGHNDVRVMICDDFLHDVIPETVGQYTGLKDKNRMKVFEGDIVKTKYGTTFEVCFGLYLPISLKEYLDPYVVVEQKIVGFYAKDFFGEEFVLPNSKAYEVIGNVHDNPELLEVEK